MIDNKKNGALKKKVRLKEYTKIVIERYFYNTRCYSLRCSIETPGLPDAFRTGPKHFLIFSIILNLTDPENVFENASHGRPSRCLLIASIVNV